MLACITFMRTRSARKSGMRGKQIEEGKGCLPTFRGLVKNTKNLKRTAMNRKKVLVPRVEEDVQAL